MSQQYVLLREKSDSLNSLIGKSFNEKSKLEAEKILTEIHKGYFSSWTKALVYCIEPKTNEILGVGGSSLLYDKKRKRIHSDLLMDNFGEFLRALFTFAVSPTEINALWKSDDGVTANYGFYIPAVAVGYNDEMGMRIQIGSSSVIARTDFKITTPFVSSPESLQFNILANSTYQSGTGKIIGISITISPTGGSGTVRESALFLRAGVRPVGNGRRILFAHDAISPVVNFTSGKIITVNYTWQL